MKNRKSINVALDLGHLLFKPWIIVLLFILLNVFIALVVIPKFGYDPAATITWQLAIAHKVPLNASYSPLPSLLTQGYQALFGSGSISAFFFNFTLYGVSLIFIWLIAGNLFKDSSIAKLSLYLTILSPYMTWSVYVARDAALEIFGVSLLLYFASKIYCKGGLYNLIGFSLAGAVGASLREPILAVFVFLLIFLGLRHYLRRGQVFLAGGIFLVALSPLLMWNYIETGTVTISSRTSIIMYYGNHPNYLDGHPLYDIDNFISKRVEHDYGSQFRTTLNNVEREKAYRELAFKAIMDDPAETAYRMLLKGLWWFGPTRVPSSDSPSYLDPVQDVVILQEGQSAVKELLYVIHRIVILFFILYYWKHSRFSLGRAMLLLLPTLALMPVVMLTSPDSHYRLALDPYTYILAAAGLIKLTHQITEYTRLKSLNV